MHFLKEGQKIQAWVDPPLIRAMPERKRFFSVDVFPYVISFNEDPVHGATLWLLSPSFSLEVKFSSSRERTFLSQEAAGWR